MKAVIKGVLRMVFGMLFRVRVEGDRKSLSAERLLIVANHQSLLDGIMLGLFLPVDPVFVVHTEVARNFWFRLILGLTDYLPVDPSSPMAMKQIVKLVKSGRPVVIFPEGRLTVTGSLMKVYEGPSFVAARTEATIVSVRLDGLLRSYFSRVAGLYPRSLFPRVTITILEPRAISMPDAPKARQRRRMAGAAMRRIMQEMLFKARAKQSVFESFLEAMEVYGRHTRFVEDKNQVEYSYGELLRSIMALGRMASRLAAEREIVGVLMPNMATTINLFLGLNAFRRVPAMLNYTAGAEGVQSACVAAGIRTIVSSRAFVAQAQLQGLVDGLSGVRVVYLEDLKPSFGVADKLWLLLWAVRFPRLAALKSEETEPAAVLFTSGSEGKPKGVVLSHRALLANIAQIRAVIDFSPADKILQRLAAVPRLRPHRRRLVAGADRYPAVPVSLAAAQPGHPQRDLRPKLHGAVRHFDLSRQLRQIRRGLRFPQPALRGRRR